MNRTVIVLVLAALATGCTAKAPPAPEVSARPEGGMLDSTADLAGMAGDPDLVVGHGEKNAGSYAAGHVAGAHCLPYKVLSRKRDGVSGMLPGTMTMSKWFGDRGIGPETRVVFYDDRAGAFAARGWLVMDMLGYRSYSIIDTSTPDTMLRGLAYDMMQGPMARHTRGPARNYYEDLLRLFRAQVSFQVKELLVHAARNAAHEHLRIDAQRARQLRDLVNGGRKFLGVRPDAVDRCTDRERLAMTIGNRAAMRRDPLGTQVARVGLLVKKLLVEHLQVHGAGNQRRCHECKERQHQRHPALESPCSLLLSLCAAFH